MKYILLVLFTAFSISLNAQMSPPTVTRSGNSLTQQDSYLTVAKRLGIPTSSTDDLDAAVTAQNSIKLLYNTTLNQLRVYNPLTLTWSGIGGSILASNGNYVDNDSVKLGGALTENTIIERNNNDFIISNGDSSEFRLFDNSFTFYSKGIADIQGQQSFGLTSNLFTIGNYEDSINLFFTNLKRKDTVDYILGVNESSSINPLIKKYTLFRTPISGGGGGSTYLAKNGIKIESDTIKLGGNITEDTKLDNPNSKSVQIGSDGDAINLNVPPPSEFGGLISTYTGFDYRSPEYMSFIGVLKGLNFAPLGFSNQDMVGTFTITGNPFDSIYPDGSIMVDGVWEDGGAVAMNKVYLTFLGGDLTFNLVSQFKKKQSNSIEGDNAIQNQSIEGDNGNQRFIITGDNATQLSIIRGDNATQKQSIEGENGEISRLINDSVNNARALEEITSTSYLFSGLKVIGSDTIKASNSISPDGFVREFRSGSLTNKDTLNENMYKVEAGNITLKLDSTGLNYGTIYSPFNLSGGAIKYEYNGVTDTLTLKSTFLKINPTNLEVTGDVKLSGVTTGIPINTYGIDASGKVVKFNLADYLPKTLVEFRGSASYTGTTSESVVYASPAIPSTAWRENGNYILTILGVCQAAQTQNAVIKIYLNTANTLNGSEILINQSHVLTDNTYTPNGGNVLAIHLPIFKNTIELLTNKGNSTIANINTGSIFSSNINMTYAKTRTKVTPNFTGNLYLIITTTQSAGSVTTEINNIIFKEI